MDVAHPSDLQGRALWLAAGHGLVALVVYFSITSAPPVPEVDYADKAGHLAAYATLMFWFAQLYAGRARIACVAALVLLGLGLEGVQALLPWRSFDPADLAANTAGVVCGWVVGSRFDRVFVHIERVLRGANPPCIGGRRRERGGAERRGAGETARARR